MISTLHLLKLTFPFVVTLWVASTVLGCAKNEDGSPVLRTVLWSKESLEQNVAELKSKSESCAASGESTTAADYLIETARLLLILGDVSGALNLSQSAFELAQKTTAHDIRDEALAIKAEALIRLGKLGEASKLLRPSLNAGKASPSPAIGFVSGLLAYESGDATSARVHFEMAVRGFQSAQNVDELARSQLMLAYVLLTLADPMAAETVAQTARASYVELNNARGIVLADIAIGVVRLRTEQFQSALSIFLTADRSFPRDLDYLERGDLCNFIGQVYKSFEDWNAALGYFQSAADLYEKEGHPVARLATLPNLAFLNKMAGNSAASEAAFAEGFELAESLGNRYFAGILYEEMGNATATEDPRAAIESFTKAR